MQSTVAYDGSDDTRLARLAFRQHGVVAYTQLLALGYTDQMIRTRVAKGRLHRLYRGVYAVGHVRLDARGRWLAAVMACGSGSLLSHRPAAALHDLRTIPIGPIDVTAPTRHAIAGVRCHFGRAIHPDDIAWIDAIPVTSIERTSLDMAEISTLQQLRTLLEAIQRRDRFDLTRTEAMIARNPGRRGLKRLRQALSELTDEAPWTQSELERAFLEILREHGFPEPAANVVVCGEVVDLHWPAYRVVVELDGWQFHKARRVFESDRERDSKLMAAGERPIRITERRIRTQLPALLSDLRQLLSDPPVRAR